MPSTSFIFSPDAAIWATPIVFQGCGVIARRPSQLLIPPEAYSYRGRERVLLPVERALRYHVPCQTRRQ